MAYNENRSKSIVTQQQICKDSKKVSTKLDTSDNTAKSSPATLTQMGTVNPSD